MDSTVYIKPQNTLAMSTFTLLENFVKYFPERYYMALLIPLLKIFYLQYASNFI